MSRPRRFGEDYAYGLEHFARLPELYVRVGHRFDQADRDWTEFCHWCKMPLALIEMVHDKGQDLADKGVSVTRRLAVGVGVNAYLMAWRTDRPPEVQAEIDRLNTRVIDLTRQWPITGFRAQLLTPRGPVESYTAEKWWELVAIWHREHHQYCPKARFEVPVNGVNLARAQRQNRLWVPVQLPLSTT